MTDGPGAAFGIDAFALDDRMRLFHFLAADKQLVYLWILREFNRARANYQVLLHTPDVAGRLVELAAEHPECPAPDDLAAALDALVDWGNLDRGQDAARAATTGCCGTWTPDPGESGSRRPWSSHRRALN